MASTTPTHFWLVPAAIVIYTISLLSPSATPILISGLVGYIDFSETQAGFVATSSLFSLAVGTMCITGLVGRLKNRNIVIVASLLTILANTASVFLVSFYTLTILQILSGFGFGLLYGIANSALAATKNPDRKFAIAILVLKISAAIMLFILPYLMQVFKHAGVFSFLIIVSALSLPVMLRIPESDLSSTEKITKQPGFLNRKKIAGLEIVVITFLFFVVNGIAWSMSSRIGQSIGLPLEKIGIILGTVVTVGMLGPLAASLLATTYGRMLPLAVGIGLNIAAIFGLSLVQGSHNYFLLLIVFDITFLFIHPYLLGIASDLSKDGKWVVTASSISMIGFGLSPSIGGLLIQHFGMASLGWFSIVLTVLILFLLFNVLAYLSASNCVDLKPANS